MFTILPFPHHLEGVVWDKLEVYPDDSRKVLSKLHPIAQEQISQRINQLVGRGLKVKIFQFNHQVPDDGEGDSKLKAYARFHDYEELVLKGSNLQKQSLYIAVFDEKADEIYHLGLDSGIRMSHSEFLEQERRKQEQHQAGQPDSRQAVAEALRESIKRLGLEAEVSVGFGGSNPFSNRKIDDLPEGYFFSKSQGKIMPKREDPKKVRQWVQEMDEEDRKKILARILSGEKIPIDELVCGNCGREGCPSTALVRAAYSQWQRDPGNMEAFERVSEDFQDEDEMPEVIDELDNDLPDWLRENSRRSGPASFLPNQEDLVFDKDGFPIHIQAQIKEMYMGMYPEFSADEWQKHWREDLNLAEELFEAESEPDKPDDLGDLPDWLKDDSFEAKLAQDFLEYRSTGQMTARLKKFLDMILDRGEDECPNPGCPDRQNCGVTRALRQRKHERGVNEMMDSPRFEPFRRKIMDDLRQARQQVNTSDEEIPLDIRLRIEQLIRKGQKEIEFSTSPSVTDDPLVIYLRGIARKELPLHNMSIDEFETLIALFVREGQDGIFVGIGAGKRREKPAQANTADEIVKAVKSIAKDEELRDTAVEMGSDMIAYGIFKFLLVLASLFAEAVKWPFRKLWQGITWTWNKIAKPILSLVFLIVFLLGVIASGTGAIGFLLAYYAGSQFEPLRHPTSLAFFTLATGWVYHAALLYFFGLLFEGKIKVGLNSPVNRLRERLLSFGAPVEAVEILDQLEVLLDIHFEQPVFLNSLPETLRRAVIRGVHARRRLNKVPARLRTRFYIWRYERIWYLNRFMRRLQNLPQTFKALGLCIVDREFRDGVQWDPQADDYSFVVLKFAEFVDWLDYEVWFPNAPQPWHAATNPTHRMQALRNPESHTRQEMFAARIGHWFHMRRADVRRLWNRFMFATDLQSFVYILRTERRRNFLAEATKISFWPERVALMTYDLWVVIRFIGSGVRNAYRNARNRWDQNHHEVDARADDDKSE